MRGLTSVCVCVCVRRTKQSGWTHDNAEKREGRREKNACIAVCCFKEVPIGTRKVLEKVSICQTIVNSHR